MSKNFGSPLLKTGWPLRHDCNQVLHIAIDRTNWGCINLLMISLIWEQRAIPIYFELLSKQGSTKKVGKNRSVCSGFTFI